MNEEFSKIYEIKQSNRWLIVDEWIFRSWTGERKLNGEPFNGDVYILGTDEVYTPPMHYNIKALRKSISNIVKEYKRSMLDRYSIVDIGGRKWKIEYNVLYWHEEDSKWGKADWDYFTCCYTQKEIFEEFDLNYKGKNAIKTYDLNKLAVNVCLMCDDDVNKEVILNPDGTKWEKK